MAEFAAHKWGQIIGNLFQHSLREQLQRIADRHHLYLDYQKARPTREGVKVSWRDRLGNAHDRDYVLERGGTEDVLGQPAAFIEVAWRRYTKHSKNKAQEIEGAVLALAETYAHVRPFLGIVLAGEFTGNALAQLRSRQFTVTHIPYQAILDAFATVGIDASWGERTPERQIREKIKKYQALSAEQVARLKKALLFAEPAGQGAVVPTTAPMEAFLEALHASLMRRIVGITVTVWHGHPSRSPRLRTRSPSCKVTTIRVPRRHPHRSTRSTCATTTAT